MYSLATRTNDDTDKFIKIVKPYIEEIPSLLYKIRNCSTKENFIKIVQSARHYKVMI